MTHTDKDRVHKREGGVRHVTLRALFLQLKRQTGRGGGGGGLDWSGLLSHRSKILNCVIIYKLLIYNNKYNGLKFY